MLTPEIQSVLQKGVVIPAHPLALNRKRKLDERRQRALSRYYLAAGAGGLAIGVHTTQFEIHDPKVGLLRPVLQLAAEEMDLAESTDGQPLVRVGGVCGPTPRAVEEATQLRELGYHAGLLNLAALKDADEPNLIQHCQAVASVIPIFGFYLQPSVGGRSLPFAFWRRFVKLEAVVAIKIAPFDRYRTIDVIRAVAEAGRRDIALYTGNDDNIVLDLLTPYRFCNNGRVVERRIVGGLLGHWAVWTRKAVELLDHCHRLAAGNDSIPPAMLQRAIEVTDANAAFFYAANNYRGCVPGIHEVLRRRGLLEGIWCLDSRQNLSPSQEAEIERVLGAYPHLNDDEFVAEHLDEWLKD